LAFKHAGDFDMFARVYLKAPFERVPRYIACFRRTGTNNSVVNRTNYLREGALISHVLGPRYNLERQYWRYLGEVWTNFRNPEWLLRKLSERMRFAAWAAGKKAFDMTATVSAHIRQPVTSRIGD
jgi:hypothetical protein